MQFPGGGTENKTVTFTQAEKRENIKSGEKHKTIFGKIARWFADLKTVAFTGSYNDLDDRPSAFPPSAHKHGKADITDFPSSMPASDVPAWAKAASRPSYTWNDIGSKPSSFPPSSHSHADYAALNHSHAGYAALNHTHTGYAHKADPVFTGTVRMGRMRAYDHPSDGAGSCVSHSTVDICLRYRQFSNEFQVVPNTGNGAYGSLGTDDMKFAKIYAGNIYNSSGMITSSDRDMKKGFKDISPGFAREIIDGLKPVSFLYKDGTSGRRHYALVVQDVEELLDRLGISTKDFAPLIKDYQKKEVENEDRSITLETDYGQKPQYSLRYEGFTGIIIKYIQCLSYENRQLAERTEILEEGIAALENIINQWA
ncbi:MAG: tail fiber domain-containing protein [Lachnospiraceae bacterium]|nr:tail fiber domain-containing protein [Lachnospiraceae bacterium]